VKGFTLIEFVIVLLIIGVLASLAIPAYCNYTVPAEISRILVKAEPLKKAIALYYKKHNTMPSEEDFAVEFKANSKDYLDLESVSYQRYYDDSAAIIYKFNRKLTDISFLERIHHKTLVLRVTTNANRALSWDCRGGDLPAQYRPKLCQPEQHQHD
jgi:prepilin-type N-terminal cleavage/methylation domain-containing protein